MSYRSLLLAAVTLTALAGCGDDDSATAPSTSEPTLFRVTVENVSTDWDFLASGGFTTPEGASEPGPAGPGSAYLFRVHAAPGHRLSFATMFVQSNDLFYAPGSAGIALYDAFGAPRSGDVTDEVMLWDAGTEADQEPGVGSDQAPRQSAPDTGSPDSDSAVRLATDSFGNLPAVRDAVRVTLTYLGEAEFEVRIEVNAGASLETSSGNTVPVLIAPGVFTVGTGTDALFSVGVADRGEGLEALAEDGAVDSLVEALAGRTGLTSPLAPGAFAVHATGEPIFSAGTPDRGEGLEGVAEDGRAGLLGASLAARPEVSASGVFDTPEGAPGPGPLLPGAAYVFDFEARPGDRLSFATMLVQSNDLFYAPPATGLALFQGGVPRSGDVTDEVMLWDAGTEVNQAPGAGADQAPRQSGDDVGADEGGEVRLVDDGFAYPVVDAVVRVTITPIG